MPVIDPRAADDIREIREGQDYPWLWWESAADDAEEVHLTRDDLEHEL